MLVQDLIIEWFSKEVKEYEGANVDSLSSPNWKTGIPFCAIIHRFYPQHIIFPTSSSGQSPSDIIPWILGISEKLGIPRLLSAQDLLVYSSPDPFLLLSYISQFYYLFRHLKPRGRPPREARRRSGRKSLIGGAKLGFGRKGKRKEVEGKEVIGQGQNKGDYFAMATEGTVTAQEVIRAQGKEKKELREREKLFSGKDSVDFTVQSQESFSSEWVEDLVEQTRSTEISERSDSNDDDDDDDKEDGQSKKMKENGMQHVAADGSIRYLVNSDLPAPLDLGGFMKELDDRKLTSSVFRRLPTMADPLPIKGRVRGGSPQPKEKTPHSSPQRKFHEDLCSICSLRVSLVERIVLKEHFIHKNCFNCLHCNCTLLSSTYKIFQDYLFCTTHYTIVKQMGIKIYQKVRDRHFKENADLVFSSVKIYTSLEGKKLKILRDMPAEEQETGENSSKKPSGGKEEPVTNSTAPKVDPNSTQYERRPTRTHSSPFTIIENLKKELDQQQTEKSEAPSFPTIEETKVMLAKKNQRDQEEVKLEEGEEEDVELDEEEVLLHLEILYGRRLPRNEDEDKNQVLRSIGQQMRSLENRGEVLEKALREQLQKESEGGGKPNDLIPEDELLLEWVNLLGQKRVLVQREEGLRIREDEKKLDYMSNLVNHAMRKYFDRPDQSLTDEAHEKWLMTEWLKVIQERDELVRKEELLRMSDLSSGSGEKLTDPKELLRKRADSNAKNCSLM